jgi:restriction endonuclease S subunit
MIQREIISILDKFTDMESQLESELSARRSQLVFFRAKLLDFKSIDSDVTQGAGGS